MLYRDKRGRIWNDSRPRWFECRITREYQIILEISKFEMREYDTNPWLYDDDIWHSDPLYNAASRRRRGRTR